MLGGDTGAQQFIRWRRKSGALYSIFMHYKGIKGKVWEKVKLYVRKREKHCYTCSARNLQTYNAQAGHYRPVAQVGSNNKWSWDKRFIHLQCGGCNGKGQGEQAAYRAHLIQEYGEEVVLAFDNNWRKVNPVIDWNEVMESFS